MLDTGLPVARRNYFSPLVRDGQIGEELLVLLGELGLEAGRI